MKRIMKYCAFLCLMAVLMLGKRLPVQAAIPGSVEIQVSKTGEGIEITLYKVADYVYGTYEYVEEFIDSSISVGNLSDHEENQAAATGLAAYALEKGIGGVSGIIGADGTLRFENLEPALYLIAQTAGEDILLVQAILVPLPYYVGGSQGESYNAVISAKYTFSGGAMIANKIDEKGTALKNAEFVLQRKVYLEEGEELPEAAGSGSDEGGRYYWKQFNTILVSNENGQVILKDLEVGDYRLVEVAAPEGYVLPETPFFFTISRAGTVKEVNGIYLKNSGTVEEVTVVNHPTLLKINKVDTEGKPLAGATLVLKDASGKIISDENGDPKYLFTTTDNPYELENLPAGDYYVSEIAAPAGYKVAEDVKLTMSNMADAVNEVTMVDEKEPPADISLTLTKKLVDLEGTALKAGDAAFYVALFADETCTQRVSDVKTLVYKENSTAEVTFQNLQSGTSYYVGETNQYGELTENGTFENVVYAAEYPDGRRVTPDQQNPQAELTFHNVFANVPVNFYYEGELTIRKKVEKDGTEAKTDETFYAAIFTDAAHTRRYGDVIKLEMNGSSNCSVTVPVSVGDSSLQSVTYYIAETDKKGTPVSSIGGLPYTPSMDKESVTLALQHTADTVVITNTFTGTENSGNTSDGSGGSSGGNSGRASGSNVRTGDDTPLGFYMILLVISLVLILSILWLIRRRGNR